MSRTVLIDLTPFTRPQATPNAHSSTRTDVPTSPTEPGLRGKTVHDTVIPGPDDSGAPLVGPALGPGPEPTGSTDPLMSSASDKGNTSLGDNGEFNSYYDPI